jgi:hypothetical protein
MLLTLSYEQHTWIKEPEIEKTLCLLDYTTAILPVVRESSEPSERYRSL